MNQVTIIGFTGKDAEVSTLDSGQSVAKLSMASDDGYFNKDKKEWHSITNWHTIIAWRKTADKCKSIKKGMKVLVSGHLTSRVWEKEDGTKQTVVEVVTRQVEIIQHTAKESQGLPAEPPTDRNKDEVEDDMPF